MPNSLERVYYSDVDYALDNSSAANMERSILWALKASLKKEILSTNSGAVTAWTCAGSSDSVTAGMDGSDRWTSSYNTAKLVFAAAGIAHSWIVIANTALGIWITLDLVDNATPAQQKMYVATVAPTGGSITARPTSTNELAINSASSLNTTTSTSAGKAHRCFESNGYFNFLVSQNGAVFNTCIAIVPLAETRSGDPFPWAVVTDWGSASNLACLLHANSGSAGQWRQSASHCKAFAVDGVTTVTLVPAVWAGATTSLWFGGTLTTTDAADSKYDDAPLYLVGISGSITIKGRLYDWRQTVGPAVASIFPAVAPDQTHLLVGNTWVPFTAAPTV